MQQNKVGRPKSTAKRDSILYAAAELFLEHGFSGASMDLVAKSAGVSKQTVYSHFSNKDALFSAVIDLKCSEYQLDEAHIGMADLPPRQVLAKVGNNFVNLLQDPQVVSMYRVVIGEISSNPHVAELFYKAGPQHGVQMITQYFLHYCQLNVSEKLAHHASVSFFNLLKAEFHMPSLLGIPYEMNEEHQHNIVEWATELTLHMLNKGEE